MPYRLPPGAADDPADLEIVRCAQLLQEARAALAAHPTAAAASAGAPPAALVASAGAPPAALAAAPSASAAATAPAAALASLRASAEALEPAYLAWHQHLAARAAEAERRGAFLSRFEERLTFVGCDEPPAAFAHLGWAEDDADRPVALGLQGGQLILASGVVGAGKSILGTVLIEGALGPGAPLSSPALPPTAALAFHIEEHDRLPQLLDGLRPNPVPSDLQLLAGRLGVSGAPLDRLRLVVPPSLLPPLSERLRPYEDLGLQVAPLRLQLAQLGQPGLEAALGASEGARFVQRVLEEAQDAGEALSLPRLRRFIDEAEDLNAQHRRAAHARLRLLEEIAAPRDAPQASLWDLCEPGVATVFYLGGPHMGHGRVAPLLTALLSALLMPSPAHGPFHRLLLVDEVNLLCRDAVALDAFVRTARLCRHRAATLVLSGQDLLCLPDELLGLAGLCAVFQQRSPRLFEHLRERLGPLRGVRYDEVARLPVGHALLGAAASTDPTWRPGARRLRVRPPRCLHGGITRTVI